MRHEPHAAKERHTGLAGTPESQTSQHTFQKIPRLILADRTPLVLSRGRSPFSGDDMTALEDRFWAKVDKTEGCWNWTASKFWNGYGQLGRKDGGTQMAHRIAYELCVGPIPDGLVIDHKCHNRACVNPAHLRACTQKQNNENLPGLKATNSSGFRGVYWSQKCGKWRAVVKHDGRMHRLGYFDTAEAAHEAALARRLELFTHNDIDRMALGAT